MGGLLFGGQVSGGAASAGFGVAVISFSETVALAGGDTYGLAAVQNSGAQLDITDGEVLIERLG